MAKPIIELFKDRDLSNGKSSTLWNNWGEVTLLMLSTLKFFEKTFTRRRIYDGRSQWGLVYIFTKELYMQPVKYYKKLAMLPVADKFFSVGPL